MLNLYENSGLLLVSILSLALSACNGARAAQGTGESDRPSAPQVGEAVEADSRLIVDIEIGNGNRYQIWVAGGEDGELEFMIQESGLDGNPTIAAIDELDSNNLSELFHAIAPADMELPAELLAEFGEPVTGKRGWLAERWNDPVHEVSVTCDDTWWVNTVCNRQPEATHQTWLNWSVSTAETSWNWNTYNQDRYFVAVCNQGPGNVKQRIRFRDRANDPWSQYEVIATPGTWYRWRRVMRNGIHNVHSYHFATSGTAVIDVCVARTPS